MDLCLPIVYGSRAWTLGKDATDTDTHRWMVYVRSPAGEGYDLGRVIRKVQFQLHETFDNPKRFVDQHPFCIEEVGWGEFEIIIKISFKDPVHKPIELRHMLKLFGELETAATSRQNPIIHEIYDEVLFSTNPAQQVPSTEFETALLDHMRDMGKGKGWRDWKAAEEQDLEVLNQARAQIRRQLQETAALVADLEKERMELDTKHRKHATPTK